MKRQKKPNNGFTLVELLIVIVIIGILAAVVVPSVSSAITKAKVSEGVQNARNISTMLTSEVLFGRNFTLPSDVEKFCNDNGYDLVSKVDGYAYWYNGENSTVEFIKVDTQAAVTSELITVFADGDADYASRSRIEQIHPQSSKYYYIDQREDELHEIIKTVRNLVEDARNKVTPAGESGTATREQILAQMGTLIEGLDDKVKSMKGIQEDSRSWISGFVKTFHPDKTVYLGRDGFYTSAPSNNDVITVDRVVVSVTKTLPKGQTDNSFNGTIGAGTGTTVTETIKATAPIIVPAEVNTVDSEVLQKLAGNTAVVGGTTAKDTFVDAGLTVKEVNSLEYIEYKNMSVSRIDYTKKLVNFTTGYSVTVDKDSEIMFYNYNITDSDDSIPESKILVVEKYKENANDKYKLVMTEIGADNSKKYVYSSVFGDFEQTEKLPFDNVEKVVDGAEAGNDIDKQYVFSNSHPSYRYILSEALIPQISLNLQDWGLKDTDFWNRNVYDPQMAGTISMRSTIHPGAVEYRAVAVDKNNKGYRLSNIGYLTNVNLDVAQVSTEGRICVYKDGKIVRAEFTPKVTINLPDVAKNFINLQNAQVIVTYDYQYVQHVETTAMIGKIAIPNGTVVTYTPTASDKVTEVIEDVNWQNGIEFSLDTINDTIWNGWYKVDGNSLTAVNEPYTDAVQLNQIKITSIKIVVGEQTMFLRYYY